MQQSGALLTPLRIWRERLSVRLISAVLAMSLVGASLRTSYDFESAASALDAQLSTTGDTLAKLVAVSCQDALVINEAGAAEDVAKTVLAQQDGIDPLFRIASVRIERKDGQVFNPENAPTPAQLARPDLRSYTAKIEVPGTGHELGRCTIWLDVAPARAELRDRSLQALLQNFAAFACFVAVLVVLLRTWLGRPLSRLDGAVQRIATGDLEAKVSPTGVGELRRFARTLESMRENLRDSHVSLAKQNDQLRALDRLKDEFLANTSHEIRTPLSSILGGIELLGDASERDRAEILDAMRRNGGHLLFLLNQILDFSKLQAGNLAIEPQTVAVLPLLEDVVACSWPMAKEKQLELGIQPAANTPRLVHTDPLRLRQILMNLIGNALKFTSSGGVSVTACGVTDEHGEHLQLTVADTGPGISEAAQQRLFVPFVQGDASLSRRHGGTGLGLVISQRLATALGGNIQLSSKLGVGTRITITLPVGSPAATPTAAPPANERTLGSSTAGAAGANALAGRVLLVDDAPDNRRLLSAMLGKAGIEVATAADGQQGCDAIAAAAGLGQPFDLVLMDIQMPVLDGHGATRRLRSQGHTLPIVALTAHATERDRETCLEAGFDDYATKPISRAKLTELVERFVRRASTGAET